MQELRRLNTDLLKARDYIRQQQVIKISDKEDIELGKVILKEYADKLFRRAKRYLNEMRE